MSAKKTQPSVRPIRKKPFHFATALPLIRDAVSPYPKAALFELAAEGHNSVFEILIACIVSIRTYDEVTLPVSRALFAKAPTPAALAALTEKEIDSLIRLSTFHEPKARTIRTIAQVTVDQHGEILPCDLDVLLSFKGVGPMCCSVETIIRWRRAA